MVIFAKPVCRYGAEVEDGGGRQEEGGEGPHLYWKHINEELFLKKALFFLKSYNNNFPLLFPRKQTWFVCWAYEHLALGRPFLFLLQFLGLTG